MPHANDGSITYEAMIDRFNSDLANTLGNLVNRTIAMQNKYFDGVIQPPVKSDAVDEELKAAAKKAIADLDKNIAEYKISDAVEAVMVFARRCNKYIDETMPWVLAKDEEQKERLGTVLYNLLESIHILSALISPFMPDTALKINDQLCASPAEYGSLGSFNSLNAGEKVGTAVPLFNRIDSEKLLAELLTKQEEKKKVAEKEKAENIEGIAQIAIDDFMKVELKAAEVTACESIPRAKKLLKLTLDDGSGTPRTVASGIAKWYSPDDLIGKKVVVVSNLKPAVLCGVESNGMILAADCSETDVKVLFLDSSIPNGSKIR